MEMIFLRKIKRIAERARISNKVVRQTLGTESVLHKIAQQQLKWWSHLVRMDKQDR